MSELNARQNLINLIIRCDSVGHKSYTEDAQALRDLDALLADFVKCANKSKPRLFQAEYDLLVRAKLLGYSNDA